MFTKLKKWIQKHHLVDINFIFSDPDRFHTITRVEFPTETLDGTPLDFGSFSWKPELTDIIGGGYTVSDICMKIEQEFEAQTGISIWLELDILNRIRRVLERGRSDTVGFLWGLTYYRINIQFITEK